MHSTALPHSFKEWLNRPSLCPKSKGLKRGARLPAMTKNPVKRGKRLRYFKLARTFKREHPICQKCGEARATDVHHKFGRGKFLNDVSTFVALCRSCHDWVHAHPKEAREAGLLA